MMMATPVMRIKGFGLFKLPIIYINILIVLQQVFIYQKCMLNFLAVLLSKADFVDLKPYIKGQINEFI